MRYFLCLPLFLCLSLAFASDIYSFKSKAQRQQFNSLSKELRCLVCQNEDLASSDAKLAADLRQRIYAMIQVGKSDQQIKAFMVARYGDFILFKPPVANRTYFLWFAPFLLLLIGSIVLFFVVRQHRPKKRVSL